jgi:toxin ParE1/3/4
MRRFPVEYRPEAVADLDGIFEYVLDKSGDVVTAIRFTDRIYNRCEKVGNAPSGGVKRDDLSIGIRLVPFERSAIILYRVENDTVWIVNIFAGGRDYASIMRLGAV